MDYLILCEFFNILPEDFSFIESYFNKIKEFINNLKIKGINFPEQIIISWVLFSLNNSYKGFIFRVI